MFIYVATFNFQLFVFSREFWREKAFLFPCASWVRKYWLLSTLRWPQVRRKFGFGKHGNLTTHFSATCIQTQNREKAKFKTPFFFFLPKNTREPKHRLLRKKKRRKKQTKKNTSTKNTGMACLFGILFGRDQNPDSSCLNKYWDWFSLAIVWNKLTKCLSTSPFFFKSRTHLWKSVRTLLSWIPLDRRWCAFCSD